MTSTPHREGRRRSDQRIDQRIIAVFSSPVTAGWVVLAIGVLCILFGLIAWSVRANYQADRDRDARAVYAVCLTANDRRAEVKDIALQFVENDRFFIEFVDSFLPDGLDEAFKDPLLDRYAQQVADIEDAYEPEPCALPLED
jgi:hypothetical protein